MRVPSMVLLALLTSSCTGLKSNVVEIVDTGTDDSNGAGVTDSGGSSPSTDADGDGFPADDDCDDTNAAVNDDATEICDGVDNDCNGKTDEEDPYLDRDTMAEWSVDEDGDGYGGDGAITKACEGPEGTVDQVGDCDDADPAINPGVTETCDGVDNDCNDLIDDEAEGAILGYPDDDADGLGEDTEQTWACGGVENNWDCDDTDATEPQVVDMTATSGGNGSLSLPWQTIQDGVDAADSCVIVFGGTYDESVDFGGKALSLLGVEGSGKTTIDASDSGSAGIIVETTGEVTVSGFTITGGSGYLESTSTSTSCGSTTVCTDYYNTWCGGGLYVNGATATLSDLVVESSSLPVTATTESGNDTYYTYSFGGGICALGATMDLDQVHLRDNYADQGGGLYLDESSVVTHARSWLIDNRATDGAGYAVDSGSLTLNNVGVLWGLASSEGGGLFSVDGSLDLTSSTFGENDAPVAGGLAVTGSSRFFMNSTIIYGSNTGVGVYADSEAIALITYSNVYGNVGGEYTGTSDPTGSSGNISEDPRFVKVTANGNPDDDDWNLDSTSPCIDAGDPDSAMNDADGSRNDIGVYGGPEGVW